MNKNIDWYNTLLKWVYILLILIMMGWNFTLIYRSIKTDMRCGMFIFTIACMMNLLIWSAINHIGFRHEYYEDKKKQTK